MQQEVMQDPAGKKTLRESVGRAIETGRREYSLEPAPITALDFPDPVLLDKPTLPEIPRGIFPDWLDDLIDRVAYATETPREMAAGSALFALSTACQKTFTVRVEDRYFEQLSLFVLIIMESGNRKSAISGAFTKAIEDFERELVEGALSAARSAESTNSILKARIDGLKKRLASGGKLKECDLNQARDEIQRLESELIDIPPVPQLFATDVTSEEVAVLMSQNGEKLALIADEGGIFETMSGRYGKGMPNFDVYLQSYTGTHIRVNRRSSAPINLYHPALSMCVFAQNDVLSGLGTKAGFRGRGLVGRFLYFTPQSKMGYRTGHERNDPKAKVPHHIQAAYDDNIRSLLDKKPATGDTGTHPHVIELSDAAYDVWRRYMLRYEVTMRPGEQHEQMKDFVGKLPGNAVRIAGVLHCAEHANGSPEAHQLSADTMTRATSIMDIIAVHAQQAYGTFGLDPRIEDARRVWEWIERYQAKAATKQTSANIIKVHDIFQGLKGHFKTMEPLEDALGVLRERFYIADMASDGKRTRGRPQVRIMVNPKASRQKIK